MKQLGWTSLEQSKKLVAAGLDPDTADMYYFKDQLSLIYENVNYKNIFDLFSDDGMSNNLTPCWSLGALIELMPPYLFGFDRGIDLNIYRNMNGVGWHVSYLPNNIIDMKVDDFRQITNGNNAIDSAVEMIIWLLDQNYLNKRNNP